MFARHVNMIRLTLNYLQKLTKAFTYRNKKRNGISTVSFFGLNNDFTYFQKETGIVLNQVPL